MKMFSLGAVYNTIVSNLTPIGFLKILHYTSIDLINEVLRFLTTGFFLDQKTAYLEVLLYIDKNYGGSIYKVNIFILLSLFEQYSVFISNYLAQLVVITSRGAFYFSSMYTTVFSRDIC